MHARTAQHARYCITIPCFARLPVCRAATATVHAPCMHAAPALQKCRAGIWNPPCKAQPASGLRSPDCSPLASVGRSVGRRGGPVPDAAGPTELVTHAYRHHGRAPCTSFTNNHWQRRNGWGKKPCSRSIHTCSAKPKPTSVLCPRPLRPGRKETNHTTRSFAKKAALPVGPGLSYR